MFKIFWIRFQYQVKLLNKLEILFLNTYFKSMKIEFIKIELQIWKIIMLYP